MTRSLTGSIVKVDVLGEEFYAKVITETDSSVYVEFNNKSIRPRWIGRSEAKPFDGDMS